jgi:hypothetical protein
MEPAFQIGDFLYDEFENILYIVMAYLLMSFWLDE